MDVKCHSCGEMYSCDDEEYQDLCPACVEDKESNEEALAWDLDFQFKDQTFQVYAWVNCQRCGIPLGLITCQRCRNRIECLMVNRKEHCFDKSELMEIELTGYCVDCAKVIGKGTL